MTLLTVAEARQHIETALEDEALQRLLDDTEASINEVCGPAGLITEYRLGGGTYIFLKRRAGAIVSITEAHDTTTPVILETTAYRLGSDGGNVIRLDGGNSPRLTWYPGHVKIVYQESGGDYARRIGAQIALLELEVNYDPLVSQETIGTWSEQKSANSAWNYHTEREAILAGLANAGLGFA